jgi:hypothetical protein
MTTREAAVGAPNGRGRVVVYWISTAILATEGLVGGALGGLRMPPFIGIIRHLGYPPYFMTILGIWYLLFPDAACVGALVDDTVKFPRKSVAVYMRSLAEALHASPAICETAHVEAA